MNEWGVVTALVTIVGLFFTVGRPIIKLNSNITLLNANVEQNNKDIAQQKKDAKESHQKLWDKNDEQDKTIANHETRIAVLEKTK